MSNDNKLLHKSAPDFFSETKAILDNYYDTPCLKDTMSCDQIIHGWMETFIDIHKLLEN